MTNFQELASFFSGGVEHGTAFVPAEICRIFRSSGESFLHLVSILDLKSFKCSVTDGRLVIKMLQCIASILAHLVFLFGYLLLVLVKILMNVCQCSINALTHYIDRINEYPFL